MPASDGCCRKSLPASGYLSTISPNPAYSKVIAHIVAPNPFAEFQLPLAAIARHSALWRDPELSQSPPSTFSILKI